MTIASRVLHAAAGSDGLRSLATSTSLARGVVERFIAGEAIEDVVQSARTLSDCGLASTIDHLGEYTLDRVQANAVRGEYVRLLSRLAEPGLSGSTEVSLKLSAVGQALADGGEALALDNARQVCTAARLAGTTVTLDRAIQLTGLG